MFGLLKFLFYSCVAVVVGVVIGTVPIGGRTVAERIAALYQSGPLIPSATPKKAAPTKALARAAPRGKAPSASPSPTPSPSAAAAVVAAAGAPGPVSAGAANSPDGHTDSDKAGLNQLLAAKAKKTK
ncbi:MAG TPA: hypothetical protein VGK67_39230 [Myxococcales bacterium]|jgi:hypothetical protein